jgi:1-acyl-sn-glycerol-3-phosphate acyltransferase
MMLRDSSSPELVEPGVATPVRASGRLATAWRRLRRMAGLGAVLSLGAVICFWLTVVRAVRRRVHPRLGEIACWWHGRVCRALGIAVRRAAGTPRVPALLAANHVSWLDVVVVGSLAPTAFVSKAEVASWPLVGWLAAVGGTLFIPRGAHQAGRIAEGIRECLAEGRSILIFPEGTTTDGSYLRPFFPRLLAGAIEAGAAVQPVAVLYPSAGRVHPTAPFVDDESFSSHLWRVLGDPGIEAEVRFCTPLAAGGGDRKALAREARAAIAAELGLES